MTQFTFAPLLLTVVGLNEGGDLDQGKAIFSNPTDVVVEGKGEFTQVNSVFQLYVINL